MVSRRTFLTGIYQEHFEELGFMYERRLQWLDDPDLTFDDIGELEQRMEAHLDGLVLGEKLASEVCTEGLSGEDFGTLYSATSVFCRSECWELVEQTLVFLNEYVQNVDESQFEDVLRARKAMADALAFHAPADWEPLIVEALKYASPGIAPVLARCAGYRRFKSAGKPLCEAASRQGADAEDFLWALGRVHHPDAVEILRYHALWGGARTAVAAAIGGLRSGDHYILNILRDRANGENWPATPLAIGGSAEDLSVLLTMTEPQRITSEALIALGVLGDMRAIPRLLEALTVEKTAEASATGLYLLTGVAVAEERELPDLELMDEDDNQGTDIDVPSSVSCRLSLRREVWAEHLELICGQAGNQSPSMSVSKRMQCLRTLFAPHQARVFLAERLVMEEPTMDKVGIEPDMLHRVGGY